MPDEPRWWFCLKHNTVEPDEGCPNTVRMGPYGTREEAVNAIELAHERTEKWDEEDRRWRGEGDDDDE